MQTSDDVLKGFYAAVVRRDFAAARKYLAQGENVAVFFELQTRAPAKATTLVAEWHQVRDGKIVHVESAFDGRPFAAMFAGAPKKPA